MFFSLETFLSNLDDFVKYYSSTEAIHAFLNNNKFVSQFSEYNVTTQKKYEYLVAVISLYGLLERFIEDIVCEYLDKLSRLKTSYSELPDEIQKNNISLSAELLTKLGYKRYVNIITKEQVISSLHECLRENKSNLVGQAFVQHTANYRIDEIVNVFSRIGIKNFIGKHKSSLYFKKYYKALNSVDDISYSDESKDRLYEKLNFLTNKRNEVAHGDLGNIIGRESIHELVEYIRYFCMSISDVVFKEYLFFWISDNEASKISVQKVHEGNNAICFYLSNGTISTSDHIVVVNDSQNTNNPYKLLYSRVLELQSGDKTFTTLSDSGEGRGIPVGVKIDMKVRLNNQFGLCCQGLL